jgi:DNA-binding response OmpR family regulator
MEETLMPSNIRPRVLYVDDDEDSREMLSVILKVRGIETKAVGTGGEALSAIQTEHFELYLLDGWLPDLDGFELCRQMRDFDSQTPILFFSGTGCDADKKMGYQAGANGYVVKPSVSDLLETITQFIPHAQNAVA